MKSPRPVRIAQLVVGALAVAAIALTFAPEHPEAGDAIVPVSRRAPMPDFTMSDLRGGAWSLSAHRGRIAKQYIGEVSERTVREDVDRLMAEL